MIPAAYAVLSLNALKHNVTQVRLNAPNAKVMAVIKANAYGHGLVRVAHALANEVDGFAVARVAEGIRLRKAGIEQRIAVLAGFTCAEELDALLQYQLDVVVHSYAQLENLEQRTEQKAISVWLKIDTGMNRLGFKAAEFDLVYSRLRQCPIIKTPINIMTHLANADDKTDNSTASQIALFKQTVARVNDNNHYSIANSAGLLLWQDALSDWVRPGIMLYGISPFMDSTGEQLHLKPVMSLHSRLIAVKAISVGEKVGYAGTWTCQKATILGVVAIGYGDGYPRHAREQTPVLVNGQRVPLIGRVSMDMITVDLASQPNAQVGDSVTLWGEGLSVEEIALCANTIPYTLVCGVTQRVHLIEQL
jgi:alanine racemase